MYQLKYHQKAVKQFKKLDWKKRRLIMERLKKLSGDPYLEELDIKKLAGTSRSYRLRVGNIRVIYEISPVLKKVFIWEIGFRGQVY